MRSRPNPNRSASLDAMLSPKRTLFCLLMASFAVVALVACAGKSDDKSNQKPTEVRASQLAHAALLDVSDLSGQWALFGSDNFRNDDASLPDNGNCAAARTLASEMSKANVAVPNARYS